MNLLTETQARVMGTIWEADRPIKRSEIQSLLTDKEWKTPTLNTFLAKLVQLGFLRIEHDRKDYVYHVLISRKEYLAYETEQRLKKLYGNSIGDFLEAFCPVGNTSKEDIREIEAYLKKLKGKK
ncbi:MAG: BlaI/MecI/CopY family transcriptional regulator [Firmicutes bacterium]|nr:BlaI/MecI/CopY family transcriptional regulator [Bacillota bacterium]